MKNVSFYKLRAHLKTNSDIGRKQEFLSKLKKNSQLQFIHLTRKKTFHSSFVQKIEFVEIKSEEAIYKDSYFFSKLSQRDELNQLEILRVHSDSALLLSKEYIVLLYKDSYFWLLFYNRPPSVFLESYTPTLPVKKALLINSILY
jgi:hypothetical protein